MSLIETALKRLQRAEAERNDQSAGRALPPPPSAVLPAASKRKVSISGPKHHVTRDQLIRGGMLVPSDQDSLAADAFRRIKRPLIDNAANRTPGATKNANIIMLTSALPNAGKTFCAVNLAVSMSHERDLNVLLVDADVDKRHISREFGLGDAPGLIELLLDDNADINEMLVRTDLNDIQVLPAGRYDSNATELLASGRMAAIVNELATRYSDRLVILDSPPMLVASAAQAVAPHVGQIIVVVEAGSTSHQELNHTLELLNRDRPINIILNKTHDWSALGDYVGVYGSYYGSAQS